MNPTPQPAPGNNTDNHAAATLTVDSQAEDSNAKTATEKESDAFLNAATHGQTMGTSVSGQQLSDQMDDSRRSVYESPEGPSPASGENVPRELTDPSEARFTLPEMQHQGKTLTAEGDDDTK